MPRLWNETIEAHRREVREAVLDTTAALVADHGLLSVTMSRIADDTGIGRATLYEYFPDVETILLAWNERQIEGHLSQLAEVRDHGDAGHRLEAVLEAYALISHESHGHRDTELAALMHRDEPVARAEHQLRQMLRELVTDAVASGDIRDDAPPDELVTYCLHAGQPADCHPGPRSVGWLRSRWLGCAPLADSFDPRSPRPVVRRRSETAAGPGAANPPIRTPPGSLCQSVNAAFVTLE